MITRHLARRVADGVLGVLAASGHPPAVRDARGGVPPVSSAVKIVETMTLADGSARNRTFFVAASALSFTPLAQAAFLTGGSGIQVPAMPDPPLDDVDPAVDSITYHQRDAGFERTTVYRRNRLDSANRWSAWQLLSDRLEWRPPAGGPVA
ncbi:MAG TPA: hypothetical protein VMR06_02455 [Dokdonella sp.]|uniref:hypothetical protein n=1 Tax=Dokdonella sp. TaxID=2291710 RepID=UPI002C5E1485|nr:hypothetical protein [Dokdonella sp.]HUD40838.1 hypothetical protein [Dokdonella sp.]